MSPTTRHDVVLRILDHQVTGSAGELLGNVDNLELVGDASDLRVTGLMVGPAALSERLPGKAGEWTYAVWRRLHPSADPLPTVVPLHHVTRIGPTIELDAEGSRALAATFGLERWLRRFVISRIPGATAGDDKDVIDLAADPNTGSGATAVDLTPSSEGRAISRLLGLPVHDEGGADVGRICELRCAGRPADERQETMRVTHLQVARHMSGSELGYGADPSQGPRLLGALIRRWQRDDRLIPMDALTTVDLDTPRIVVSSSASLWHPHADSRG